MKPRTTAWVIERYDSGLTTIHGAASWLFYTIDPDEIDTEMSLIPEKILPVFRNLALHLQPGKIGLIGFDQEPPPSQV